MNFFLLLICSVKVAHFKLVKDGKKEGDICASKVIHISDSQLSAVS